MTMINIYTYQEACVGVCNRASLKLLGRKRKDRADQGRGVFFLQAIERMKDGRNDTLS